MLFSDVERENRHNDILGKLTNPNYLIVQTGSGGLHIYCNKSNFKPTNDAGRSIKMYTSEKYDIDVIVSNNPEKNSLIVLPGSKVKKDYKNKEEIAKQYIYLRGNKKSVINYTIYDVFNDLSLNLDELIEEKRKENSKVTDKNNKKSNEKNETHDANEIHRKNNNINVDGFIDKSNYNVPLIPVSNNLAEAFIEGFNHLNEGVVIHRDAGDKKLEEEITLYPLFCSINALPTDYIDKAYEAVYNSGRLTDNAMKDFNTIRKRYTNNNISALILAKIFKLYACDYYNDNIKCLIQLPKIITENI